MSQSAVDLIPGFSVEDVFQRVLGVLEELLGRVVESSEWVGAAQPLLPGQTRPAKLGSGKGSAVGWFLLRFAINEEFFCN